MGTSQTPLVAIVFALLSSQASAHAFLRTANPGVDSVVSQPPRQVVIEFTEGVEPAFSSIIVQDASGARVDDASVHLAGGRTRLAVGLKSLPAGKYRVTWRATSTDTHKTQGGYSFTVKR
jgi:methionine-rich copper-binding protein CopC